MHDPDLIYVYEAMAVLQDCVRAGRKLKANARASFKERSVLFRFKIPLAIGFEIHRCRNVETIRGLLRAESIYMEESFADDPFELSTEAGVYPYFAGEVVSDGVTAQLWAREPIWN